MADICCSAPIVANPSSGSPRPPTIATCAPLSADLAEPTDGDAMRIVADIPRAARAFAEGPDGRLIAVGHLAPSRPNT
jgi:hypothetical protein